MLSLLGVSLASDARSDSSPEAQLIYTRVATSTRRRREAPEEGTTCDLARARSHPSYSREPRGKMRPRTFFSQPLQRGLALSAAHVSNAVPRALVRSVIFARRRFPPSRRALHSVARAEKMEPARARERRW